LKRMENAGRQQSLRRRTDSSWAVRSICDCDRSAEAAPSPRAGRSVQTADFAPVEGLIAWREVDARALSANVNRAVTL
jgi:hypothetical protein